MPTSDTVHILAGCCGIFSHVRPLVFTLIKMAILAPNLVATFPIGSDLIDKTRSETELLLIGEGLAGKDLEDIRSRVRLVVADAPEDFVIPASARGPMTAKISTAAGAFNAFWDKLHSDGGTGDLPLPSLAIIDGFVDYDREHFRRSNPKARCLTIWPTNMSFFLFQCWPGVQGLGPDSIKAFNSITDIAELERVLEKINLEPSSDVVSLPDFKPMYRWESWPTRLNIPDAGGYLMRLLYQSVHKNADGIIFATGSWYEPKTRAYVVDALDVKAGKPTYPVNILIPSKVDMSSTPIDLVDPNRNHILRFLDEALTEEGPDSVIYISFGSIMGPINMPWQVDVLIDTLIAAKRRFVFSQAALMMFMTPELQASIDKAAQSGFCATSAWIPQMAVLRHPAVGVFLSHGGWNSVCENIISCKPMVCWPFLADHPFISASLSEIDEPLAWELYEVRGPTVTQYPPYFFKDGPRTSEQGETIPVPTGTPEAMRAELERVLVREAAPGSPLLAQRKERWQAWQQKYLDSVKPGGETERVFRDLLEPLGCQIRA